MGNSHAPLCQSIFTNNKLTSERYTSVWINLINQIEKSKETVAIH